MGGPTNAGNAGNLDVNIQDLHTRPVIAHFNQVTHSTTLSVAAVKNAYTITVATVTGFTAGKQVILFYPDGLRFSFYVILSAAGPVLTLDTPIDYDYPIGTFADSSTIDLNVNGAITPQTFGIRGTGIPAGVELTFDVTRVLFECICDSPVDLSLFGNIAALTRGLVLRCRNGETENVFNVKSNGDLASIMFDWTPYAALNPVQGTDGFAARLTFSGQSKIGVVIRLPIGEDLEIIIQDDLTNLTKLHVVAEGHITEER